MSEPCYLDAELAPNASLSALGVRNVMIVFVIMAGVMGVIAFVITRILLVPILLLAATSALAAAFQVRAARAAQREWVRVGAEEVIVSRGRPRQAVWRSPSYFTRVEIDEADEDRPRVRLTLSGRRFEVARALGREERLEFARALDTALWKARRGRREP